MPKQSTMLSTMLAIAKDLLPDFNSSTVSKLKVENVLNPPQNPMMSMAVLNMDLESKDTPYRPTLPIPPPINMATRLFIRQNIVKPGIHPLGKMPHSVSKQPANQRSDKHVRRVMNPQINSAVGNHSCPNEHYIYEGS